MSEVEHRLVEAAKLYPDQSVDILLPEFSSNGPIYRHYPSTLYLVAGNTLQQLPYNPVYCRLPVNKTGFLRPVAVPFYIGQRLPIRDPLTDNLGVVYDIALNSSQCGNCDFKEFCEWRDLGIKVFQPKEP